jgi:hypothetical protein
MGARLAKQAASPPVDDLRNASVISSILALDPAGKGPGGQARMLSVCRTSGLISSLLQGITGV